MFEQEDEGTRIGLWVVIGVVALVVGGVIGGVVLRQMHAGKVAPAPAAVEVVVVDEVLVDAPLGGELVSTLYFEVASADLPADARGAIEAALQSLAGAPGRSLMLSGFHDATGDPAFNADLAKRRAVAVRDALVEAGAERARLQLRRPESTLGDGSAEEARRVEIRLLD
jgi:outer membrane protein OmpA-like peptidoglycan-associated protein